MQASEQRPANQAVAPLKIVYFGPPLAEKRTSLHHVFAETSSTARSELEMHEHRGHRSVWFQFGHHPWPPTV